MRKIIERSFKPLTADEILQDIPGLYQLRKQSMVKLLQKEASAGTIHRWSAAPGSRKERFWCQDETIYFKERIIAALSHHSLTKTDLLERVKKDTAPCSKTRLTSIVNTTLTALIKEKTLFEIPPFGSHKKSRYAAHPPDLKLYLGKTQKEFDRVCQKLKKAGIDSEQVFTAFSRMLSLPPTSVSPCEVDNGKGAQPVLPDPELSETILNRIVTTMIRMVPGAPDQAPVWIPDLRNALKLSKNAFDRAILILAERGKVFLNKHAHPAQMSDVEKETMIADGQGNYYVVVVLREGKSA